MFLYPVASSAFCAAFARLASSCWSITLCSRLSRAVSFHHLSSPPTCRIASWWSLLAVFSVTPGGFGKCVGSASSGSSASDPCRTLRLRENVTSASWSSLVLCAAACACVCAVRACSAANRRACSRPFIQSSMVTPPTSLRASALRVWIMESSSCGDILLGWGALRGGESSSLCPKDAVSTSVASGSGYSRSSASLACGNLASSTPFLMAPAPF